jgi:large subunit ribosomal protein LP0
MFMQALNIPTKINKGTVEIVSDVNLITQGEKVGASEATLLAKLGIKPFSYGLIVLQVPPPPPPPTHTQVTHILK